MTIPHKHVTVQFVRAAQVLTFEFVVLRVSGEKAVGEELGKSEARVLWPVLDVVPHGGLKLLHELW